MTATSCPRRASAAASTASWRWLPPTAKSRMKNKTFIPALSVHRRPTARGGDRPACAILSDRACPFGWYRPMVLFVAVEEARSAVWRVRHFAGFRAVVGRARQPHHCGLRRQYPRRPQGHPGSARSLCGAEHCLYLGDRRASVFCHKHGDARSTSRAQAPLRQCANFLLSLSQGGRDRRGARPLLLRPVAHQADSRPSSPGDRHPYLLAFLLLGRRGRYRGLPGRPRGCADRRRTSRGGTRKHRVPAQPSRSSRGVSRIGLACLSRQRTRLVPPRTERVGADASRARMPLGRQLSPNWRSARSRAGACRWHGRYSRQPLSATSRKKCRVGAPAPAADHVGHGNGGASPKAFSFMVAPAQFRRRFAGQLGVSAGHPRLLPRLACALRDAVDADGGARRRRPSCPRTKWWRRRMNARATALGCGLAPCAPISVTAETTIWYFRLEALRSDQGWVVKFAPGAYRAT